MPKKDDSRSSCISGNAGSKKKWLDKCLKSRLSEDPETENMANQSKHGSSLNDSTFTKFINILKVVALEKVSFSDTENPKTVC